MTPAEELLKEISQMTDSAGILRKIGEYFETALKLSETSPSHALQNNALGATVERRAAEPGQPEHRGSTSAASATACSADAAMLENYAKSYDGMGDISGHSVAYDIRHNMIPALRRPDGGKQT